jgi:hypothetical protein
MRQNGVSLPEGLVYETVAEKRKSSELLKILVLQNYYQLHQGDNQPDTENTDTYDI